MSAISDRGRTTLALGALLIVLLGSGCSRDGHDGDHNHGGGAPPPDPEPTQLTREQDAPGVHVEVLSLAGASGADGAFQVGDRVRVRFSLKKDDGGAWGIDEFPHVSALISGPTFNFQRVIAEQVDVAERASVNSNGEFTYVFPPLPARYLEPYNDSASFGPESGELSGQTLLAGTYAVSLGFGWRYQVGAQDEVDVDEAVEYFRFGGAAALTPREVTSTDNCNACHVSLRAHEGLRRNVEACVLCHTSGAEDLNDPGIEGGTPGRSIDLRVMVHSIHNGRHLPSVNGVAVDVSGNLIYGQTARRYVLVDGATGAHDYSDVGMPIWPTRTIAMPRDLGFSSLSPADQATEDVLRTGLTQCSACHGDPDGAGPLGSPSQGDTVYAQPSMRACNGCHDDVDYTQLYVRNQQEMPIQTDDSGCSECHTPDGGGFYSPIAVRDGHLHPLQDPEYTGTTYLDFSTFLGANVDIVAVREAGANNGDGDLDPGERVELELTIRNDAGANLANAKWSTLSAVLSGPSHNTNLLLQTSISKAQLSGAQPFTIRLPEARQLELLGVSTGATGDVFDTARAPHIAPNAQTQVLVRSAAAGGASLLVSAAGAQANFVDVGDSTGFARDDAIVIDDGTGAEEYLRIQFVDGQRLWFSSPATPSYKASTVFAHSAGASVTEVVLTPVATNQYTVTASSGRITETGEFGASAKVLASYVTEYELPDTYPIAANASPDLDETTGKWTGKALEPGTYRVLLTLTADLNLNANIEDNFYTHTSSDFEDVLVAGGASLAPYDLIGSSSSCDACHKELDYHDGRYRGFDTCITCHAAAGAEDRPRYVAANAPATPGVSVTFRELVHALHRGTQLTSAPSFTLSGEGAGAYPDNFTDLDYDFVHFPAQPGGVAQCAKCHGATNTSWISPADRTHSTDQLAPTLVWKNSCGACHASPAAFAHYELNTTLSGIESCSVCHGPSANEAVELVHRRR